MNVKCCAVVGKCAARQDPKCPSTPCFSSPPRKCLCIWVTQEVTGGKMRLFKECAADSTLFSTLSCLFCPSFLFLARRAGQTPRVPNWQWLLFPYRLLTPSRGSLLIRGQGSWLCTAVWGARPAAPGLAPVRAKSLGLRGRSHPGDSLGSSQTAVYAVCAFASPRTVSRHSQPTWTYLSPGPPSHWFKATGSAREHVLSSK